MSLAKTCDRCGKVMKVGEPKAATVELVSNFVCLGFVTHRTEHFDLCDACVEDFRKFLRNKFAS